MIVVADAPPLLYLSRLDRLDLIEAVYGEVVVPRTVWQELVVARPDAPGVEALKTATFISVSSRAERHGVPESLTDALDAGEAAAICLAELESADLLLIDERKGRKVAEGRGLRVRGTLSTVVEARRLGAIASVRPVLDALAAVGFRVSPALVRWAVNQAGEGSAGPSAPG